MESLPRTTLSQYLERQPDVVMAFLFGSHARGQAHAQSDVDLAVYFDPLPDHRRLHEVWDELERISQRDVDLVVLNDARPSIADTALRGERLVVKDERLWLRLMLAVSAEAEDFRQFVIDLWELRRRHRGDGSYVRSPR